VHCSPSMGGIESFHTFTNLEDRCLRLLVKNLSRDMPDSFIWEKLESLDIHAQGVIQLCSSDQDPAKDCPLTPHFTVLVALEPEVSKVR